MLLTRKDCSVLVLRDTEYRTVSHKDIGDNYTRFFVTQGHWRQLHAVLKIGDNRGWVE